MSDEEDQDFTGSMFAGEDDSSEQPERPRSAKRAKKDSPDQASKDWQKRVIAQLKLRTEEGDEEALRILGLEGADLAADSLWNSGEEADLEAGEELARVCAHNGRLKVLEWLAGEDVNLLTQQPDTGYSCALLAAEHGHFNCLKKIHELAGRELLRAADVLRASDLDGFTSAHWAVQNGRSDMLTWLVQVGGTQILKAADKTGATVVMEAASNDHLNIVKWIVSQIGSDCLRTVDDDGETAVFDACGGDCQAVVEYIAETLGIDNALRVMNKAGLTPLNYLENLEGTEHAQPAMLTHLKKLLVVPDDLPEMWHATWDPGEGRYYFWHEDTKTPQWDKPTGPPPGWVRKAAPAPAPVPQAVPQAVPQQVPQYMQQPAAVPQYQQQPFGAPAMGMGGLINPGMGLAPGIMQSGGGPPLPGGPPPM